LIYAFNNARNIGISGLNEKTLKNYEAERRERTTKIVKQSWNFGVPARWKNPLAVWLREKIITSLPESVTNNLVRENVCYDVAKIDCRIGCCLRQSN
jgi:2-polyprenyl-6-methoxyphenol hydroxylase-like FAD-dependent oxidoreductase